MRYFSRLLGLVLLASLPAGRTEAVLLYGLDSKAESATGAADATINEFSGLGVKIVSPITLANWLTVTSSPVPGTSTTPTFSTSSGQVTVVASPTGQYAHTLTFKVDLTGSHNVTFDRFGIALKRGGNVTSNIVSNAFYSTDGTNFTSTTVGENDLVTTGVTAEGITLKTPDGLGGTIGPGQVYVVGGLNAAGVLNTGSFYVRLTVGAPSSNQTTLTVFEDRNDLSTTTLSNSTLNTTDLGADDGYDLVWFGSAVAVPEPSAFLFGGLATSFAGLTWRRRKR